jgi:centrosomal protein CEP97
MFASFLLADNRLQTQPVNGAGTRKSPKAMKRIEKPSVINSRKFPNNSSPRAQPLKAQNHFSDASTVGNSTSDDDSDSVNIDKLKTIRNKAAQQKNQKQKDNNNVLEQQQTAAQPPVVNKTTENSAILIQKIWRGFCARKQNSHIAEVLQRKRTQDYIIKLTQDMEMTKAALENERKIQQLQMQAINALWKKVTALQTTNESSGDAASATSKESDGPVPDAASFNLTSNQNDSVAVVQDLTKTCSLLMNQVQQLQVSMRDIITFMSAVANIPPPPPSEPQNNNENQSRDSCETQTEIVAVHTPQVEDLPTFPFTKAGGKLMATGRPSSLPIMHSKDRGDGTSTANIAEEAGDDGQDEPKEDEIDQQLSPSDDVVV